LKIVGQNDTLDELQEQIQNAQEFMTDATVINGIQSKSFEQLWDALKTRQQQFYGIAANASIKFLENSDLSVRCHPKIGLKYVYFSETSGSSFSFVELN
jgi:hypothetical protein